MRKLTLALAAVLCLPLLAQAQCYGPGCTVQLQPAYGHGPVTWSAPAYYPAPVVIQPFAYPTSHFPVTYPAPIAVAAPAYYPAPAYFQARAFGGCAQGRCW